MELSSFVKTNQDAIEALSSKIGGFSIYLGVMLFFNLYLFFRGKRASKNKINKQEKLTNKNTL
jgi:F0F1-type ATP synthase assembly protein I